jgi:branched-chain amino acid transport system ATP-binding protein
MKRLLAWTGSADSTITSEAVMAMAEKFNTGQEVCLQIPSARGVMQVKEGTSGSQTFCISDLTVEENLLVGAKGGGGWGASRVYEHFPKLGQLAGRRGGSLSGGEQQMLTVARTLMGNPRLLLLDEPSEGLAPQIVQEVGRVLGRLKTGRLSILLVEQNYHLALAIADRVYVMSKGQIVYEGQPAGLEADETTKRRYLGVA